MRGAWAKVKDLAKKKIEVDEEWDYQSLGKRSPVLVDLLNRSEVAEYMSPKLDSPRLFVLLAGIRFPLGSNRQPFQLRYDLIQLNPD